MKALSPKYGNGAVNAKVGVMAMTGSGITQLLSECVRGKMVHAKWNIQGPESSHGPDLGTGFKNLEPIIISF